MKLPRIPQDQLDEIDDSIEQLRIEIDLRSDELWPCSFCGDHFDPADPPPCAAHSGEPCVSYAQRLASC